MTASEIDKNAYQWLADGFRTAFETCGLTDLAGTCTAVTGMEEDELIDLLTNETLLAEVVLDHPNVVFAIAAAPALPYRLNQQAPPSDLPTELPDAVAERAREFFHVVVANWLTSEQGKRLPAQTTLKKVTVHSNGITRWATLREPLTEHPVVLKYELTFPDTSVCGVSLLLPPYIIQALEGARNQSTTNSAGELGGETEGGRLSQDRLTQRSTPSGAVAAATASNLDLIMNISLVATARLGRVEMPLRDILNLGPGSIVEIGHMVDEPIELLVNDKVIARGEVVLVDEKFGLRITEIMGTRDRIESLRNL